MIQRIVFFIITSAVYPALFYVIVPWSNSFKDFSESTDPAGGGMAAGFSFYYGCLFSFIIWFVLSTILAHWCVRTWWIGVFALIVGGVSILAIEAHKKEQANNLLRPYERHYESGMIREKGYYIGQRSAENKHGKITGYYPDGTVKSVDSYERGVPLGPCESYYPDGKLMVKGEFKGGEWNNGELIGIQDGNWIYYRKDGSIDDERTYAEGKLISSKNFTLYFNSTKLVCVIVTGKPFTGKLNKTGIVGKALFPNLYTVPVNNGRCDGDFCSYYTTGKDLIVAATATYVDGELNGQLKKYYPNGQLMTSAVYVNGKIEGNYTSYYENGALEEETEYSEGKKEGVSRKYGSDGKLILMYNYHNGDKDGAFQSYNINDGSYQKGSYEKGEVSYRESYRADGTLISIYQWRNGKCIRSDNYDLKGNLVQY